MGDSKEILRELTTDEWSKTRVAYVSGTDEPQWAKELMEHFQATAGVDMHTLAQHQVSISELHVQRLLDYPL
jgi:Acid Phosphatase